MKINNRSLIAIFTFIFVLSQILVVPISVSASSKSSVTVSTQKELNKALKSNIKKIVIQTSKKSNLTVKKGNYSKKQLVVNSSKVSITNKGSFKCITIKDAVKFTEKSNTNRIICTDKSLKFYVSKGYEVSSLNINKSGSNVSIYHKGSIDNLVVSKVSSLKLSVSASASVRRIDVNSTNSNISIKDNGDISQITLNSSSTLSISGKDSNVSLIVNDSDAKIKVSNESMLNVSNNTNSEVNIVNTSVAKISSESSNVTDETENTEYSSTIDYDNSSQDVSASKVTEVEVSDSFRSDIANVDKIEPSENNHEESEDESSSNLEPTSSFSSSSSVQLDNTSDDSVVDDSSKDSSSTENTIDDSTNISDKNSDSSSDGSKPNNTASSSSPNTSQSLSDSSPINDSSNSSVGDSSESNSRIEESSISSSSSISSASSSTTSVSSQSDSSSSAQNVDDSSTIQSDESEEVPELQVSYNEITIQEGNYIDLEMFYSQSGYREYVDAKWEISSGDCISLTKGSYASDYGIVVEGKSVGTSVISAIADGFTKEITITVETKHNVAAYIKFDNDSTIYEVEKLTSSTDDFNPIIHGMSISDMESLSSASSATIGYRYDLTDGVTYDIDYEGSNCPLTYQINNGCSRDPRFKTSTRVTNIPVNSISKLPVSLVCDSNTNIDMESNSNVELDVYDYNTSEYVPVRWVISEDYISYTSGTSNSQYGITLIDLKVVEGSSTIIAIYGDSQYMSFNVYK